MRLKALALCLMTGFAATAAARGGVGVVAAVTDVVLAEAADA